MISVKEALGLVEKHANPLPAFVTIKVAESNGCTLYKDVYSPMNMPPFNQSAMDGYALYLHEKLEYNVIGEVQAGDSDQPVLQAGEAVRIFTGAAVPETANTVVMQEKIKRESNSIILLNPVSINQNIRPLGEQVKTGELALTSGTLLNPAAIAYVTSLGITEVSVFKKPTIAIVTTGNELLTAGQDLPFGKIYESNSVMLQSAIEKQGFEPSTIHKIKDDFKSTLSKLDQLITQNDVLIISGGISVGDYDFVGKALKELGVEEIFYKVKQKPGKPLFFGKKGNTLIFALPGNPAAALTCFYVYVTKAIQAMKGNNTYSLHTIFAKSESEFIKKGDRAQFLKAIFKDGNVTILEGQSSAMLQTFALANALVFISEKQDKIIKGDRLEVILLPQ